MTTLNNTNSIKIKKIDIAKVNVGKIQFFIDKKKIKVNEKINLNLLKKISLINQKSHKVKILANGDIKDKVDIEVDFISKSAREKLDKTGSTVKILK